VEAKPLIDQIEALADATVDALVDAMPLSVICDCLKGGFQAVYLLANGHKTLHYIVHKFPELSIVPVTLDD
jgi:hypothetical protein